MHKTKLFLALASQLHLSVDIDPSFAVIEVLIKEKKKEKTIDKEVVVDGLPPIYNVSVKRFIKKYLKCIYSHLKLVSYIMHLYVLVYINSFFSLSSSLFFLENFNLRCVRT